MAQEQDTQHALLVPWGHFAREIGLISGIEAVKLNQKVYEHRPQAKVIEFLVAILSGAKHLQDISLAAHPLDKDLAVAEAWGRAGWADYSGSSRTLKGLSWAEAQALVAALEDVSQPFLESELAELRFRGRGLQYDGVLTGLPVSNTSRTYPNTAYGHMSDEIRLGYQAEVVSFQSPTYGRLWLSVEHHAGDTVSCTQAEALVLAALNLESSRKDDARVTPAPGDVNAAQAPTTKSQHGPVDTTVGTNVPVSVSLKVEKNHREGSESSKE